MKKKMHITFNKYLEIAKTDIYVYSLITIILSLVLLCIGKTYYFFFDLILILMTIGRIITYYNLKSIKLYLIENSLLDKIGKIDYWNEKNYFLTENYVIIKKRRKVFSFKYSDIKRLFKNNKVSIGRHSGYQQYLHIITSDNEFEILVHSTKLVDEEFKDITDYLINKNPNIKLDK